MHLLLLLTLVLLQQSPAEPRPETDVRPAVTSRIAFIEAPFELPASLRDSVRFGYLEVPQEHDDPASGTFRLAVLVLPARTRDPAADPVIFIPGGPGEGVIEGQAAVFARSQRIALYRERRDFILIEPRGHGLSEPRMCPELEGAAPLVDGSAAAESRLVAKLAACRAQLAAEGVRLQTLSAVHTARDIDLLRRALGASQVNLLGGSYGSRIALETMRQVPSAIRSAHLIGPVAAHLPYRTNAAETPTEVLPVLFRRCAERPECRAAYPRLASDYDTLLAVVRRAPLLVSVPRSDRVPDGVLRVDENLMRTGLAQLLLDRDLAAGAPLLIHTLAARGLSPLERMTPQLIRLFEEELSLGTQLAFRCNDSYAAPDTPGWLVERCRAWLGSGYGDREQGAAVRSDIPTLILTGEFDPRTPPSSARAVAGFLSHSYDVPMPWTGHGRAPDCAIRVARDFFDAPERMPPTACMDSVPPIEFVTGVVSSRWIGNATIAAAGQPVRSGAPAALALLLLLVPVVALPVREVRVRRRGTAHRPRGATTVLWLAAATALTLLLGLAGAAVAGSRQHSFVPALGVPAGWRWLLALPWLLLALALLAVLLWRRDADAAALPGPLRWSALGGVALVLGLWAFHSLS